jgi:uncharacterized protein YndB with AHSA1/START domain
LKEEEADDRKQSAGPRITIRGTVDAVWRELTRAMSRKPRCSTHGCMHAQAFVPGAALQMRTPDGRNVLVVGRIVEFDPPRRFAHTFRFTQYEDPECTVIYELKPVPAGVEVSLVVENIPLGTRSAKEMASGSTAILDALKAVVETGRPALGTRLMYWLFGRLGFMLPARTRAEHWPL